MTPGYCTEDCSCRCHTSKKQARSPSWLTPFVGSLMVEYDITAITKPVRCDRPGCQRSASSTSLEYSFPSWLYYYNCMFNISTGSMAGYGAYLRLSVPRQAPHALDIMRFLDGKNCFEQLKIHSEIGGMYYPTDMILPGCSLFTFVISWGADYQLETMMKYWSNVLPITGITSFERQLVHGWLSANHHRQSSQRVQILKKILSLTKRSHERTIWPLHDAIRKTSDVESIIIQHRHTINTLDHRGWAPIHIAIRFHNHVALKSLIRHGADVNLQDSTMQDTPLHWAVRDFCRECVETLLDSKCEVSRYNRLGLLPIHFINEPHDWDGDGRKSVERKDTLELLLKYLPWQATAKSLRYGETILIMLADNERIKPEAFRLLCTFILEGGFGVDLDSHDNSGFTAALLAAKAGNLECLQVLVEAGARLDSVCGEGNILHLAACYADVELLNYLRTQNMELNWCLTSEWHNSTPWDVFRWITRCDLLELVDYGSRRSSIAEAHAFALLYSEVRDRALQRELDMLLEIMEPLRLKQGKEARRRLKPLLDWHEAMEWVKDYETYRTLGIQIDQEMWDAAIETVQENMDLCRRAMRTSPWRQDMDIWEEEDDKEDYSSARKQFDDLLVEKYGAEAILYYREETFEEESGETEGEYEFDEATDSDGELESDEE
ncbi:hypothetical protein B0T21DRAFT_361969 [Apiosordaria backusii]|uniref:Ankyrin n=1 Tax=Apiosordaria backusii TaxID=314023 RepID=A0AA40EIN8_9PEZI|nr:hypothetical protein B0T21DRAFT_361969 [Apiosordaria backusii]